MASLSPVITRFLFAPIRADGFGLMRIGWAATALFSLASRWSSLQFYYAHNGILGQLQCGPSVLCSFKQQLFTETGVLIAGAVLCLTLCGTLLAWKPRLMILISLVLIHLLHQRNELTLNGGDRVIRIVGFYLLIAPQLQAYSYEHLKQWWLGHTPAVLTMPCWPYRLLLWQVILLYGTSALSKLSTERWLDGNVIALTFHNHLLMRFSPEFYNLFASLYTTIGTGTVLFELAWLLLLIPAPWRRYCRQRWYPFTLKQTLLLGGLVFHSGILVFMDLGTFSLIMFTMYAGLLTDEDWPVLKQLHLRLQRMLH